MDDGYMNHPAAAQQHPNRSLVMRQSPLPCTLWSVTDCIRIGNRLAPFECGLTIGQASAIFLDVALRSAPLLNMQVASV